MQENSNYKVTISFPIYNVESTIKASLLSALNQTYKNLEILAVDDCGKDKSVEILEDIVSTHPRGNIVKLVAHEKNLGLGAVRNTSIKEASGEYIYFMDSDDLLYHDTIQTLVNLIETNQVDFVTSSFKENRNGEFKVCGYNNTCIVEGRHILLQQYKSEEPVFVYMWNKLIRIDFLKNNHIKCIHPYVEDDMFTFYLLAAASKYCKYNKPTYEYIIRGNSITNKLMSENIPFKTAEIYIDIIKRKLEYALTIADREIASLISIYVLNSAFLRFYQIDKSSIIVDDEKKKSLEETLLELINKRNLIFSKKIVFTKYFIKYLVVYFVANCNIGFRKKLIINIQKIKKK